MIRMRNEYLLVEREPIREKIGSLFIPEVVNEKPVQGKVIAMGEKVLDEVSVGETVMFAKYSGQEIVLDGVEYVILPVKEIFGVLNA